jgi:hypothetical protein
VPEKSATLHLTIKVTEDVDAWVTKIEARVRDWVHETAMLIEEYAKDLAPVNLGELRASIKANLNLISGAVFTATISTSCGYGMPVEKGSEPHWPPPGPLEEWAKRVLGDARLGFVVARAIAERGTDPQPFMYPAYERALNEQLPKLKAMFH